VRDPWLGRLNNLGVEIISMVRLRGVDSDTVYFEHITGGGAVLCEGVDTLVLSMGHESESRLEEALRELPVELIAIGDCLCPRTAEEAILEGLEAGIAL